MTSFDLLLSRLRSEVEASNVLLALWKLERAVELDAFKAGFRPDQSRVPAGSPEGGQWTSEGRGPTRTRKPKGALVPSRHHFMPQSLFKDPRYKLSPEAQKVFDDARLHSSMRADTTMIGSIATIMRPRENALTAFSQKRESSQNE